VAPDPSHTNFWSRIVDRNKQRLESWISDQFEYVLQAATLVFAYGVFKGLRLIKINNWVIDVLEPADQIAVVLVFLRFLFSTVRRAFTPNEER
jgi:hypothetical protein